MHSFVSRMATVPLRRTAMRSLFGKPFALGSSCRAPLHTSTLNSSRLALSESLNCSRVAVRQPSRIQVFDKKQLPLFHVRAISSMTRAPEKSAPFIRDSFLPLRAFSSHEPNANTRAPKKKKRNSWHQKKLSKDFEVSPTLELQRSVPHFNRDIETDPEKVLEQGVEEVLDLAVQEELRPEVAEHMKSVIQATESLETADEVVARLQAAEGVLEPNEINQLCHKLCTITRNKGYLKQCADVLSYWAQRGSAHPILQDGPIIEILDRLMNSDESDLAYDLYMSTKHLLPSGHYNVLLFRSLEMENIDLACKVMKHMYEEDFGFMYDISVANLLLLVTNPEHKTRIAPYMAALTKCWIAAPMIEVLIEQGHMDYACIHATHLEPDTKQMNLVHYYRIQSVVFRKHAEMSLEQDNRNELKRTFRIANSLVENLTETGAHPSVSAIRKYFELAKKNKVLQYSMVSDFFIKALSYAAYIPKEIEGDVDPLVQEIVTMAERNHSRPTMLGYDRVIAFSVAGQLDDAYKAYRQLRADAQTPLKPYLYHRLIYQFCFTNKVDYALTLLFDMGEKCMEKPSSELCSVVLDCLMREVDRGVRINETVALIKFMRDERIPMKPKTLTRVKRNWEFIKKHTSN